MPCFRVSPETTSAGCGRSTGSGWRWRCGASPIYAIRRVGATYPEAMTHLPKRKRLSHDDRAPGRLYKLCMLLPHTVSHQHLRELAAARTTTPLRLTGGVLAARPSPAPTSPGHLAREPVSSSGATKLSNGRRRPMRTIGAASPRGQRLAGQIRSLASTLADCIRVMTDYYAAAAKYEQLSRLSDNGLRRRGLSRERLARDVLTGCHPDRIDGRCRQGGSP